LQHCGTDDGASQSWLPSFFLSIAEFAATVYDAAAKMIDLKESPHWSCFWNAKLDFGILFNTPLFI